MNMLPSSKELDRQSFVKIDEWIELGSAKQMEVDDDPGLTKKWFHLLTKEPAHLFLDDLGRSWCRNDNGQYCPFHVEHDGKLYGIRMSAKALN